MAFSREDILQLKEGNKSVQKELILQYSKQIYNLVYYHLQNKEESEEVTQDVFLKIIAKAHTFNFKSKFETWMYRLAVNETLDRIRYNQRQKRKVEKVPLQSMVYVCDHRHQNPSQELQSAESKQMVLDAIEKLPESQKTAILLAKMEGKPQKEVADIMNISVKAVESLIQRAKNGLREHLQDYFERKI